MCCHVLAVKSTHVRVVLIALLGSRRLMRVADYCCNVTARAKWHTWHLHIIWFIHEDKTCYITVVLYTVDVQYSAFETIARQGFTTCHTEHTMITDWLHGSDQPSQFTYVIVMCYTWYTLNHILWHPMKTIRYDVSRSSVAHHSHSCHTSPHLSLSHIAHEPSIAQQWSMVWYDAI